MQILFNEITIHHYFKEATTPYYGFSFPFFTSFAK